jgi:predicted phage gp36 major capsid-like protein
VVAMSAKNAHRHRHEAAADLRDDRAADRDDAAETRDAVSDQRDQRAADRDDRAQHRDEAAVARAAQLADHLHQAEQHQRNSLTRSAAAPGAPPETLGNVVEARLFD